MEFWAAFGLCCIDEHFLDECLKRVTKDGIRSTKGGKSEKGYGASTTDVEIHPDAMKKLNRFLKKEGFRLSRHDVGELVRVLTIPEVPVLMTAIERWGWCEPPCFSGRAHKDDYYHKAQETTHIDRDKDDETVLEHLRQVLELDQKEINERTWRNKKGKRT